MAVSSERPDSQTSWLYCRNCGRDPGLDAASVDPEWSFCKYCGYQLTAMPRVQYAGFWIRVAAYLIDFAVLVALSIPLEITLFVVAFGSTVATLFGLAITLAYFSVGNGRGGTIGRRALGLRVINDAGNAPGVRTGASLFILSILSRLALGLGYLWMIKDHRKQTWHDKLCGTYVIRRPAPA